MVRVSSKLDAFAYVFAPLLLEGQYAQRAGIEGTQSQAIRRCGIRQCRDIGHANARLQHILTATALNLVRVAAWLEDIPRATTRRSAFATLAA
jgi:transposase